MKFARRLIGLFGNLGVLNTAMILGSVGFSLSLTALCAFVVFAFMYGWYVHSTISFAVFPVILLFGIPTLVWLTYGISNMLINLQQRMLISEWRGR